MSYVSKSKKAFQPKVPSRRPPPSASNTPSLRDSQEPSRISATPQPTNPDTPSTETLTVSNIVNSANATTHSQNELQPTPEPDGASRASVATPPSARSRHSAAPLQDKSATTGSGRQQVISTNRQAATPAPSQTPSVEPAVGRETRQASKSTQEPKTQSEPRATPAAFHIGQSHLLTPVNTQAPEVAAPGVDRGDDRQERDMSTLVRLGEEDEGARDTRGTRGRGTARRAQAGQAETQTEQTEAGEASAPARKTRRGAAKRNSSALVEPSEDAADESAPVQPTKRQKSKANTTKGKPAKTRAKPKAKRTAAAAAADDDSATQATVASSTGPRRQRQRAVPETAEDEDDSDGDDEFTRKRREPTPEDAEEQHIDQEVQTMAELPDLKIGRLGERERRLRQRDEEKRARQEADEELAVRADALGEDEEPVDDPELVEYLQRKAEDQLREEEEAEEKKRIFEEEQEWAHKPSGRYGAKRNREETTPEEPAPEAHDDAEEGEDDFNYDDANGVSRFVVVDGELVQNPEFELREQQRTSRIKEQTIDDITRAHNEGAYRKKEPRFRWSEESIARIWEGISIFGLQFDMISTLIPGSSRMQVKKKYNQLDKTGDYAEEINNALLKTNRKEMPMDEIEKARGKKFVDPVKWQEETDRMEAEIRKEKDEQRQEADRLLRGRGQDEDDGEDGEQEENGASEDEDDEDEEEPGNAYDNIEDLDEDGVVRSIEDDVPASSKRGGRGRGRGGARGSRGRGRGRGRSQA